jgi:type I restriction enzyme S subunit
MDIKHGFAFPGENIRDVPPGDILLTPGNFAIGGGFKGDKYKYFDGVVPDEYVLNEGDLIVTMTDLSKQSDTLGYPAFVPESLGPRFLHNQRLGKVLIKVCLSG